MPTTELVILKKSDFYLNSWPLQKKRSDCSVLKCLLQLHSLPLHFKRRGTPTPAYIQYLSPANAWWTEEKIFISTHARTSVSCFSTLDSPRGYNESSGRNRNLTFFYWSCTSSHICLSEWQKALANFHRFWLMLLLLLLWGFRCCCGFLVWIDIQSLHI